MIFMIDPNVFGGVLFIPPATPGGLDYSHLLCVRFIYSLLLLVEVELLFASAKIQLSQIHSNGTRLLGQMMCSMYV